jgi:hypothetical protein
VNAKVQAAGGPLAWYQARQRRDQAVAPYAARIDALAARLGCDRELVADAYHAALTPFAGLDPSRDKATLRAVAAWRARRPR